MAELALLGTIISAGGSLIAGGEAREAAETQAANEQVIAEFEADQLRENAQHERASASFSAKEQDLQTELTISKQIARAASSGGGVTNPTVLDLIDDTQERGTILAQAEVFKGEQRARGLLDKADVGLLNAKNSGSVLRKKGKAAQTVGTFKSASTLISGFGNNDLIKAKFG